MRILVLFTVLSCFTLSNMVRADELESCSGCSDSQAKQVALQSIRYADNAHIVDFLKGTVRSFEVEHIQESGINYSKAVAINSPNDYIQATRSVSAYLHEKINEGGHFDPLTNVMTTRIEIPVSIAKTASDVKTYEVSQAVSNYIRLRELPDAWNNISKAWQMVIEKILFKVVAEFDDGTTATYVLRNIYLSDHPYTLEEESVFGSGSNGGSFEGNTIRFGTTDSGFRVGNLKKICVPYSIKGDGKTWVNQVCWWLPV